MVPAPVGCSYRMGVTSYRKVQWAAMAMALTVFILWDIIGSGGSLMRCDTYLRQERGAVT